MCLSYNSRVPKATDSGHGQLHTGHAANIAELLEQGPYTPCLPSVLCMSIRTLTGAAAAATRARLATPAAATLVCCWLRAATGRTAAARERTVRAAPAFRDGCERTASAIVSV